MRTAIPVDLITLLFKRIDDLYQKRLSTLEVLSRKNDESMKQVKDSINELNQRFSELYILYGKSGAKEPPSPLETRAKNKDFRGFFDKIVREAQFKSSRSNRKSMSQEKFTAKPSLLPKKTAQTGFKVMMKSKDPGSRAKPGGKTTLERPGKLKSKATGRVADNCEERERTPIPTMQEYENIGIP